ncbi:MAG: hypothetical protein LQ348_006296 [Seirophora lacunosa]|nr:MAG: hypothetical protein LQ348_006296 [Seirophora lacunosa]
MSHQASLAVAAGGRSSRANFDVNRRAPEGLARTASEPRDPGPTRALRGVTTPIVLLPADLAIVSRPFGGCAAVEKKREARKVTGACHYRDHPPPPIAETDIEEQPTTVPAASPPAAQTAAKPTKPKGEMTAAVYGTIQEEKARALFAKYGLTLEPGEWTKPIKPDAERVEKKIRMRVHRTCHYCQTTFGPDRVCSNCKHSRCKKCPRYPTKRNKEQKGKAMAAAGGGIATTGTAAAAMADTTLNLKSLTISSRPTGKKVTYKPVTQRVRRTCHLCSTLFEGRAIECANCGHNRCPQCPRDPAKTDKYPSGYPGDSGGVIRERHPIRVHVRWTCHQCSKTFRDLSKKCEGCQHDRCGECPRHPPKREKPKLDPDAVKKIEERMETMDISPQAVAA